MSSSSLTQLRRQFIVLGFAKGFLLWYAIEKLFQTKIGITPEQIILIGVVAQGSKVFFELPTSIFADRWDRRKTLILAQVCMIASAVVLGLSNSIPVYIVGILLWALCDALCSGVYEAFAYDTIAHAGYKEKFKAIYTRMNSSELLSIGLAGILAGVLAQHFNLRLSFFLSTISAVVCIILLAQMKEPPRERTTDDGTGWVGHIGGAFKIIVSPKVRWSAAIYIMLIGFLGAWYEYYQLLGIEAKLSPFLFGSLITFLTFGMLVGSELAHKIAATCRALTGIWILLMLTHLVGLRFASATGIFVSLFVTFIVLMMIELYLELYLQDNISSDRRATVFSLLTSLSYVWFFVLAGIFARTLDRIGIRGALTVASLPLIIVGAFDIWRRIPWATNKISDNLPKEEII